jgi:hypothetical protein
VRGRAAFRRPALRRFEHSQVVAVPPPVGIDTDQKEQTAQYSSRPVERPYPDPAHTCTAAGTAGSYGRHGGAVGRTLARMPLVFAVPRAYDSHGAQHAHRKGIKR